MSDSTRIIHCLFFGSKSVMKNNTDVFSIQKYKLIKHRYRGKNIVERDMSKHLIQCLPWRCHIEENTTLGDIFKLMLPHRDILEILFHSLHFKDYMDAAESILNNMSEEHDNSGLLVVRVICDNIYKEEYPLEVCAIGDIVTDLNHFDKYEIGKHPYESIHMVDLFEIINYRIVLKNDSIFRSFAYSDACKRKYKRETADCSIILFDLLRIILWELSWYGGSIEKKRMVERLD